VGLMISGSLFAYGIQMFAFPLNVINQFNGFNIHFWSDKLGDGMNEGRKRNE
jgi:hypothetical protein